jgi:two-component system LytT family response regulator
VIDDERLARDGLVAMLGEIPGVAVVGEADRVSVARDVIASKRPEAVFLDITMPRLSGFDLIEGLDHPPRVVVVTAYSEHAVRAFDCEAVDFLLKPVRRDRLVRAVHRLSVASGDGVYRTDDRICLHVPGRTIVVPVSQILSLEADGDFTRIVIEGGESVLICRPLGSYEVVLPAPPFVRLDRSTILNISRVDRIVLSGRGGEVRLRGRADALKVGRTALGVLRRVVQNKT